MIMTTLINSNVSSLKSFHSALSTPDTSTFEDTLVDSETPLQLPLTKVNLAEHVKNSDLDIIELRDVRMMQYIDWQQDLIEEQLLKEKEISQENLKQQMRNSIWGLRKSTINRVGYHGNHLGYYYVSPNNSNCNGIERTKITKFSRMFGRLAVPFRSVYKNNARQVRCGLYDDNSKKSNSNSDNGELIAIGYDEWV